LTAVLKRNDSHLFLNIVKLVRANLIAMAANISFRMYNSFVTQTKFLEGNDCLQFPQVTGGKLSAPANSSSEASIVRGRREMFKLRKVSFYPVSNK